jgi:hypothetical protein
MAQGLPEGSRIAPKRHALPRDRPAFGRINAFVRSTKTQRIKSKIIVQLFGKIWYPVIRKDFMTLKEAHEEMTRLLEKGHTARLEEVYREIDGENELVQLIIHHYPMCRQCVREREANGEGKVPASKGQAGSV